mmetsp:Transcript_24407/g.61955  ORF Transcript_24407/g.61955 Transcript_24407/m.61955 type:complete len:242 (-) Transcript_24407:76-801(-)
MGPRSSPMRSVVSGVSGAGFSTTVLPHARALAVGFQPRTIGAFHGAMTATTPRGERRTTMRFGAWSSMTSSSWISSSLPAFSKFAAATRISILVSAMGLPLSLVCSVARQLMSSLRTRAHSARRARRFSLGSAAQPGAARWAPTTAESIISTLASGAMPTMALVAGLRTMNVSFGRMMFPSMRSGARSRIRTPWARIRTRRRSVCRRCRRPRWCLAHTAATTRAEAPARAGAPRESSACGA